MPFTTVGEYRIRYRMLGDASDRPPLVLIHGAGGGQYIWLEQSRLAVGRQLITLDLPGHGQSTPEPESVTIEEYAEVVTRLADALAVDRFVPVGHSMGGAVALTLALEHAARVDRLVLVATGAKLPTADFVFEAIRSSFDTLAVLGDFTACSGFDVRDRLSEIGVPTLILAAAEDQLVGAGRALQLEASISDARLIVVERAGHMLMQEQPEAFNDALTEFCEAS